MFIYSYGCTECDFAFPVQKTHNLAFKLSVVISIRLESNQRFAMNLNTEKMLANKLPIAKISILFFIFIFYNL